MIRTAKSIFLAIGFLVIISFLLPGCYTQFSRPGVDTDDEYYDDSEYEDVEEYYQDEDVPPADDSRDVYIYYPYSWNNYYDYGYWYQNPYILIIGGIRTDVGGHQAGMPGFLITTIIGEDILAIMVRLIDMDILRGMQAGLFQSDLLTGDRLD